MGEFLEQIKSRHAAPETVAHKVALYLNTPERKALITEAGDDLFFYSALWRRSKEKNRHLEFFSANGRGNVLGALQILRDMEKLNRSFAIVDRDFNYDDPEYLYDEHCLVLNVYSYENFFADEFILADFGKFFFGLEFGSEPLKHWSSMVQAFIQTIPASLVKEHSLAYWCRKNSQICNLNNVQVGQLLVVEQNGSVVRLSNTMDLFCKSSGTFSLSPPAIELAECTRILLARPWQSAFRGHFFWTMFVDLLNTFRLWLDLYLKAESLNRSRTRYGISERNAIEAASSHIPSPPILQNFFTRIDM